MPDLSETSATSLAGLHVVVTRAVPQAKPLIEAVKAYGGTAIALPLLEIIDAQDGGAGLAAALGRLGPADWLVVLSPNGAHRVLAHANDIAACGRPRLACIASGTSNVFTEVGWAVDLLPDVPSSVGLLAAFETIEFEGRVLIAQAENGRVELQNGLTSRGVDAQSVPAYRNVMPDLDAHSVHAARKANVVVFASPSAVERYLGHVGETPEAAVCIGEVTAQTARNLGFSVTTASAPTVEAIVAALQG